MNEKNNINRDIKYVNRDFTEFRSNLVEFARTYFPNTVTDFSPASPGTMFVEMASYVGDVLSFYTDNQIQENFAQYAKQLNNLYALAYMMGYKPSVSTPSTAEVEIFQTVPAIYDTTSGTNIPDFSYSLIIDQNTTLTDTQNNNQFIIQNVVDFSQSSSLDPTEISVYAVEGDVPQSFLLKKTVEAYSATIATINFSVGVGEKYSTFEIQDQNLIGILDVYDSDGNEWTEVDYLAQETIYETVKNTNPFPNDINTSPNSSEVPYILKLKKVPRRFVTRFISNNNLNSGSATLQLQFGAGNTQDYDEEIVPNPENIGIGLPIIKNKLTTAYDPSNFLYNKTYGIAPSNTTLTVRYLVGGGIGSNIPAGVLTNINTSNTRFAFNSLDTDLANASFNSLACNNPSKTTGGSNGDSMEDLRYNIIANYATQLRAVTQEDYLVRALSMPSKYGSLAKAYTQVPVLSDTNVGAVSPTLDLYVCAYDDNKNLVTASNTLKRNLATYLSQYRIINDYVRIKDAFIINFNVEFEIVTLPNFNSNEVLTKCIQAIINYFDISKAQINQPIMLNPLYITLNNIQGVQNTKSITLNNMVGESLGYSKHAYDIKGATLNQVVYPSQDPSIFELKYPNINVKGKVVPL